MSIVQPLQTKEGNRRGTCGRGIGRTKNWQRQRQLQTRSLECNLIRQRDGRTVRRWLSISLSRRKQSKCLPSSRRGGAHTVQKNRREVGVAGDGALNCAVSVIVQRYRNTTLAASNGKLRRKKGAVFVVVRGHQFSAAKLCSYTVPRPRPTVKSKNSFFLSGHGKTFFPRCGGSKVEA